MSLLSRRRQQLGSLKLNLPRHSGDSTPVQLSKEDDHLRRASYSDQSTCTSTPGTTDAWRSWGGQSNPFSNLYEVGEIVGTGTYGVVRRCTRRLDGVSVVVKCVRSDDDEVREVTRAEYKLMRSLRHKSIVSVKDFLEAPLELWMVMEDCEGGSVESHVQREGFLKEEHARMLFLQLLHGVNYLHGKRIVHRDIKPSNVVLQSDARCLKITDFNSAKKIGGSNSSGLMLTDRGDPQWSAPEMRFGGFWNENVDIWSSGLTHYYMLRGKAPFRSLSSEVTKMLLTKTLPQISWGTISALTQTLIEHCLTVDKDHRPTAMELLMHPVFAVADRDSPLPWEREPASPVLLKKTTSGSLNDRLSAEATAEIQRLGSYGMLFKASAGLLFVAGRSPVEKEAGRKASEPLSPAPDSWSPFDGQGLTGSDWKESRSSADTMRRLSWNRCLRAKPQSLAAVFGELAAAGKEKSVGADATAATTAATAVSSKKVLKDGQDSDSGSPVWALRKGSAHRFFTTHGAQYRNDIEELEPISPASSAAGMTPKARELQKQMPIIGSSALADQLFQAIQSVDEEEPSSPSTPDKSVSATLPKTPPKTAEQMPRLGSSALADQLFQAISGMGPSDIEVSIGG